MPFESRDQIAGSSHPHSHESISATLLSCTSNSLLHHAIWVGSFTIWTSFHGELALKTSLWVALDVASTHFCFTLLRRLRVWAESWSCFLARDFHNLIFTFSWRYAIAQVTTSSRAPFDRVSGRATLTLRCGSRSG